MQTSIGDEHVSGASLLCDLVCVSYGESLACTHYYKIFWVNLVGFESQGGERFHNKMQR